MEACTTKTIIVILFVISVTYMSDYLICLVCLITLCAICSGMDHHAVFSLGLYQRALCPSGLLMCPLGLIQNQHVPFGFCLVLKVLELLNLLPTLGVGLAELSVIISEQYINQQ